MKIFKPLHFFKHVQDKTGREEFCLKLQHRSWHLTKWLVLAYRHTLIRKVKIVVVIGSLGKTTTAMAIKIATGIKNSDKACSNQYGALAFSILKISPFSRFKVFEVAISEPGQMEVIAKIILPDIVVFTSVGSDHIKEFKNIEHISDEKAKMLNYVREEGVVYANGDDENVMLKAKQSGVRVVSFGLGKSNDIQCTDLSIDLRRGMECEVNLKREKIRFHTQLFNPKMIYPLLAAIGVGQFLDFKLNDLLSNLEKIKPSPGRMQVEVISSGAVVLGDFFKSTIDSIQPALQMIQASLFTRIIMIFGTINYKSFQTNNKNLTSPYFLVGQQIAEIATHSIFVSEMENDYSDGITSTGINSENITLTKNSWLTAFNAIPKNLGENDLIYITGVTPQKLERIFLSLKGEKINCNLKWCEMYTYCKDCVRK